MEIGPAKQGCGCDCFGISMNKKNWELLVMPLVGGLVGASCMILYLFVRDFFAIQLPPWPLSVVSFLAALIVAVTIHELGHVLAGLLVKYGFYFVSVGYFKVERTASGLKPRFDPKAPNPLGGLTMMLPDAGHDSRRSEALFVAGGPVASVLLFMLLAITAFSLSAFGSTTWTVNAVIYFSWLTAVMSLVLGLLALIPESSGQIKSDGYHLMSIWKGSEAFLTSRIIIRLISQSLQGTRPAELDIELMHQTLGSEDPSESQMARLFLYAYYSDKGEMQRAGEYLDAAVEKEEEAQSPLLGPSVFLEKAFWEALVQGNADSAAHYFDKGKAGYSEKGTWHRAQTGVLLAKGDHEEARKAAEIARRHTQESMDRGGSVWAEAMLDRLLDKYGQMIVSET